MSWSKRDLVLNEAFDRNPFRGGGSLRFPFTSDMSTPTKVDGRAFDARQAVREPLQK